MAFSPYTISFNKFFKSEFIINEYTSYLFSSMNRINYPWIYPSYIFHRLILIFLFQEDQFSSICFIDHTFRSWLIGLKLVWNQGCPMVEGTIDVCDWYVLQLLPFLWALILQNIRVNYSKQIKNEHRSGSYLRYNNIIHEAVIEKKRFCENEFNCFTQLETSYIYMSYKQLTTQLT